MAGPRPPAYRAACAAAQNFPYDVDFFNWAVNGSWDLLYSSSRLSVPDPNVRVRNIQAGKPSSVIPFTKIYFPTYT